MGGNVTEAGDGSPPVRDLSYTAASRELDDIVRFFEQREIDVDQLVGRLERATAIVDELDRRLRRTRTQVEELVPRLAAVLSDEGAGDPADVAGGSSGHPERRHDVVDDPDDQAVEDELDQADELVETIDEVIDEEIGGDDVVGDGELDDPLLDDPVLDDVAVEDDGDPGPAEPQGLF
jgi:exonuclease VII small subunit